jgi:DNA-directed RNA polymerase subunit beta'
MIEPIREELDKTGVEPIAVMIRLASPEELRSWSYGEVKKPETLNYRTFRPEKGGLFCEKIFGPEKDYECYCGKYKGQRYKGIVCERCGVEITTSKVRKERMGHITLAAPCTHIWFWKINPSRMGAILDLKMAKLEKIIYYQNYIVTDVDPDLAKEGKVKEKDILNEKEYLELKDRFRDKFEAQMGAEGNH